MSHPPLLPQTVRIKRKRQDEPVDTLHVHTHDDSKRRRHTANSKQSSTRQAQAIFRRVQEGQDRISETAGTGAAAAATAASSGGASVNNGKPSTLFSSSRPTTSSAFAASLGLPSGSAAGGHRGGGSAGGSSSGGGGGGCRIFTPGAQATRHFHLARSSHHRHTSSSGGSLATGPAGGVKKRKNVATLVESKPKKYRSDEYLNPALNEYIALRKDEKTDVAESPLKRPGKSSAVSTPRKASNTATSTSTNTPREAGALPQQASAQANTDAATATINAASAVDPGLLADMQRFANEVETAEQLPGASKLNANNAFVPGTPSRPMVTLQRLKFQPKPTPRYRARNPVPLTAAMSVMDIDAAPKRPSSSYATSSGSDSGSDNNDPGDYVYDTYVRYDGPSEAILHDPMGSAATAATAAVVPAQPLLLSVGLLIIGADEQPLWEAYADNDGETGDADDAEREFDTDDEDSNAEDWRGNEYPDEEDDNDDDEDEDSDEEVGAVWVRGKGKALPVEDEEWDARGLGAADSDSDGWGENVNDAATWSDEEESRMRRPFAVPGWLRR